MNTFHSARGDSGSQSVLDMTDCTVSVLMVTYNHEPYIAQAIESVLDQRTKFQFELIIGEDCSTDSTKQIVLDYQAKYPQRIRVIASTENVGAQRNFNRTLKATRGKYVAFCEGDDWWSDNEKLQKQVNYMEDHPECGLLHSDYRVLHNGTLIEDFLTYRNLQVCENPSAVEIVENLGRTFRIQTCTAMTRRDLLLRIIEEDPELHGGERFLMGDTQLWAELALVSTVGYIPERLATYRLLDESGSRSKDPRKTWKFVKSDVEMKLYLCEKHGMPETLRRKLEFLWGNAAMRLAFFERDPVLAEEARRVMRDLPLAHRMRYMGSKNAFIHSAYLAARSVILRFKNNYDG